MPHVLPCPVEHRIYADGDMSRGVRRSGRPQPSHEGEGSVVIDEGVGVLEMQDPEAHATGKRKSECPVPKPGGLIGETLGFVERKRTIKRTDAADESESKTDR
ncbi:MAG: hypothetical protein M1816_001640 [Peltula sp. TS41687]|nr:MAG: hypothetical protein M1816_001640 [Peltula sp. TS41687]